jgi:16S rRNA (guanine966-N2)-methyltransferase
VRITGGKFRGRILAAPRDAAVRPTSDKVRQAIFNLLEHGAGSADFSLQGVRVLDLFAGTGALGLEALSRGAAFCLFIDDAPESRALIRRNVETLELAGVSKIWRRNAAEPGRLDTLAPFDLVFLDPPYGKGLIEPALTALRDGGWLRAHAIMVVETDENEPLAPPPAFVPFDRRIYGSTAVTLFRAD